MNYNKVPEDRRTRRFEAIYIALQCLRAREIMRHIGREELIDDGIRNAFVQELAGIVDDAMQKEVERRRSGKST